MSTEVKSCNSCIPQRWVTVVLCSMGMFHAQILNTYLSISITEMVSSSNETTFMKEPYVDNISVHQNRNEITNAHKFDWSEDIQGLILSSFFWGYFVTTILGGIITEKLGAKRTLEFVVLSTSILTLLVPIGTRWGGYKMLILQQILVGLCEGPLFSIANVLVAQWIPKNELSRAISWAFSGSFIGSILGSAVSGMILRYSSIGWPAVPYTFGGIGLLTYLLILAFCYNRPDDSPFISETEKKYLKEKLEHTHKNSAPIPWRQILTSKPIWALLIVIVGKSWAVVTISSDMPKFMSSVLKLSVDQIGYFGSIANGCSFISSCFSSWIADKVISKSLASTSTVRKVCSSISLLGITGFIVAATHVEGNVPVALTLYVIGTILLGCINPGLTVNLLDLAPNYAGHLTGILYGIGLLGGNLAPYVVGKLTPNQTVEEWRLVFWLVFAVCVVTNMVFVVFGSAELQKWNGSNILKTDEITVPGGKDRELSSCAQH